MAFNASDSTNNYDQSVTQGDSYGFTVSYKDATTEEIIPFVTGDTVTYTVREEYANDTVILQKTITSFTVEGKAEINVTAVDTAAISLGRYVFDIEVEKASGAKTTIIPDSNTVCTLPVLAVCPQVTR